MALKKSELYSSLWQGCDELRGGSVALKQPLMQKPLTARTWLV